MKNFSKNVRRKIFMITEGKCFYCGCDLEIDNFQVDHLKPKADGGIDSLNRVPACGDCNRIKASKTIEEFRSTIESYVNKDVHARLIAKHMGLKRNDVEFYFERNNFNPV